MCYDYTFVKVDDGVQYLRLLKRVVRDRCSCFTKNTNNCKEIPECILGRLRAEFHQQFTDLAKGNVLQKVKKNLFHHTGSLHLYDARKSGFIAEQKAIQQKPRKR